MLLSLPSSFSKSNEKIAFFPQVRRGGREEGREGGREGKESSNINKQDFVFSPSTLTQEVSFTLFYEKS